LRSFWAAAGAFQRWPKGGTSSCSCLQATRQQGRLWAAGDVPPDSWSWLWSDAPLEPGRPGPSCCKHRCPSATTSPKPLPAHQQNQAPGQWAGHRPRANLGRGQERPELTSGVRIKRAWQDVRAGLAAAWPSATGLTIPAQQGTSSLPTWARAAAALAFAIAAWAAVGQRENHFQQQRFGIDQGAGFEAARALGWAPGSCWAGGPRRGAETAG